MSRQPDGELDVAAVARALRAPAADLTRSPAAWRVAVAARDAGLFMFDYEARVQLELPEAWLPIGRPDLAVTGQPPTWERGVLGESKYLSFRHDTLIGSLHAGQRAKWSAHELCHGLVGFCWRGDGTMLFHALAARLAEALPVALWYFFDEAGAARCERHAAIVELGPSFCAACEAASAHGDRGVGQSVEDAAWVARGMAFLEREVDGVRRSIAEGRPVFTPHGAIDLMTDGLAYASAHAPRLRSAEFAATPASLAPVGSGRCDDLEVFAARVLAVGAYVAGRGAMPALVVAGREGLVAQDVASRFMQIAAECSDECAAALSASVDRNAEVGGSEGVAAMIDDYVALHDAYELPAPDDVFAVGYPLPRGFGFGVAQISAGLESCLGATMARLGAARGEIVAAFVAEAVPSRRPLARRFAEVVARGADAETAGLAALEAAIACAAPANPIELGLALDGALAETLRLPSGVELVRAGFDAGGLLMHGAADARGPKSFLVRRDAGDEVGLVALSEALAERLGAGPLDAARVVAEAERDGELRALLEEGLLIPNRWELTTAADE